MLKSWAAVSILTTLFSNLQLLPCNYIITKVFAPVPVLFVPLQTYSSRPSLLKYKQSFLLGEPYLVKQILLELPTRTQTFYIVF